MGKRERKIEAVKKYIGNLSGTWSAYSYGNIPKTRAENACRSYAQGVRLQDILGLVDITVNGSGRKGLTFTEYYIYYDNGMLGNKGRVSYKEVYESHKIPKGLFDPAYNRQALAELVSLLADIEEQSVQDKLDNVADTLNSINDTVGKVETALNTAMELLNSLADRLDAVKK